MAKPKAANDPHDFVVVPPDQVRVAPSDAEITDLLRAAARQHSESGARAAADSSALAPVPMVDTTFRPTANDAAPARSRGFGRGMLRFIAALLLAMGIGAAALTWQTFGYAAKKAMVKWVPQFALSSSLPWDRLGFATKSSPPEESADPEASPAEVAAADQGRAENAAPESAVAAASSQPSDAAQLQSMARELAGARQEIETLKAGIAELKASQQQLTRELGKVSEKAAESAKAKLVASPPPHPATATAARKPAPVYSPASTYAPAPTASAPPPAYRAQVPPTQAAAAPAGQPYASPPISLQPGADPGVVSAPRPPMPVQ